MKEKIQENNLRVNRASKKALAELKQVINPEQLYCLQMMTWGLDLIDDQDGRLKSTVQEMPSWKPENAMKYLTTMDGQPISPVNWSKVKDPEDLALQSADAAPVSAASRTTFDKLASSMRMQLAAAPLVQQASAK